VITLANTALDDHKLLVELACATALAPSYSLKFVSAFAPIIERKKIIVFVVCGGFKTTVNDLIDYEEILRKDSSKSWTAKFDDGSQLSIEKWL
jgi:L-serine/L-threonine ammonia-lyase